MTNKHTGRRTATPAVPTKERAAEIDRFHTTLKLIQDAFHLEVKGDAGLEIHDRLNGTMPAIVTEDGDLEILAPAAFAEDAAC